MWFQVQVGQKSRNSPFTLTTRHRDTHAGEDKFPSSATSSKQSKFKHLGTGISVNYQGKIRATEGKPRREHPQVQPYGKTRQRGWGHDSGSTDVAKYSDSPKGLVCMPTEDVETFGEDVAGLIFLLGESTSSES